MINLIPQTAKKRITREYWLRVVSVWILILTGVAFIVAVLLIPVYILINSKADIYTNSASAASLEIESYELSSSALIKASQQAQKIATLDEAVRFTDLITLISSLKNPSIIIDNFSFNLTETGLAPIVINGEAKTRQSLADFRTALLNHEDIAEAELPISSLALDRDINFTVTITIKE